MDQKALTNPTKSSESFNCSTNRASADASVGATTISKHGSSISAPRNSEDSSLPSKLKTLNLYELCKRLKQFLYQISPLKNYLACLEQVEDSEENNIVVELWKLLRLGTSLTIIFNAFSPESNLKTIDTYPISPQDSKKCVLEFLNAAHLKLEIPVSEMFRISELYQDDTNAFVKVIATLLQVLEEFRKSDEKNLYSSAFSIFDMPEEPLMATNDTKRKVFNELLLTERKYVRDLEALQRYMNEIKEKELLSIEDTQILFANLDSLVDFQRRLLIGLERRNELPLEEQHIGSFFELMESGFGVYETFCINHAMSIEYLSDLSEHLHSLTDVSDPLYELNSMLIKPIQRICRYPLLLREMLRYTPHSTPEYVELQAGLASIIRVVDFINESRRKLENDLVKTDLTKRIVDWKGHTLQECGQLLLWDHFCVFKGDTDREYLVYLFEHIILCCKEPGGSRKSSKGLSKKNKKRSSLHLKGRIYISSVDDVELLSKSKEYTIQVCWGDERYDDSMVLRCRNEEHQRQWYEAIKQRVDYYRDHKGLAMNRSKNKISDTEFVSMRDSGSSRPFSPASAASDFDNYALSTRNSSKPPSTDENAFLPLKSASYSHSMTRKKNSLKGNPFVSSSVTSLPYNVEDYYRGLSIKKPPTVYSNRFSDDTYSSDAVDNRNSSSQKVDLTRTRSADVEKITVNLYFAEDAFMLPVPENIDFASLYQQVLKKVKIYGKIPERDLRLRYVDEDGDFITMNSDEDVQMAFESRSYSNMFMNPGNVKIYVD